MNRKWILAVAALAAVAIAGWWWTRDRGPAPDRRAGRGTADLAIGSAHERGPAPRGADVDPGGRARIDDDPAGELRLEGLVVDAGDLPVAGVTVMLGSNPPRTTTTGDDGGFVFDALVGRPYTLVARGTQGIAGPITARLTATSDPIVMKLRPGARLTVRVTDDRGAAVVGATVELRGLDVLQATATAGSAVFAPVAPGGYQIAAWAPGKARTFQWLGVAAGDTEASLVLVAGAAVEGRVVDERGAPVAGARVRFSGASDWSQQGDERYDGAVSDATGAFAFEALPAGSFRFVATHASHAPGTSALVTLDGTSRRDGVTITLAAGAVVRGRVVDAANQPVASARVRVGVAANPRVMVFDPPRQAYTDATGAFAIEGLPRRELSIVALHETGASESRAVDATAGDVGDVTLTIDVTGTIAGVVIDPEGQPIEGVQVSAGPSFGDNRTRVDFSQWRLRGFPQELTDAGGRFTLTGLAPGTYTLSARRSTGRGRRGPGIGDGVTAKPGDTNVRLVLQPEGGVKGKVAFADGTAPAMFTVSVGMTQQSFGGEQGAFELDGLPPQRYELTVRGPGFQTRSIEVEVVSSRTVDAGTIAVAKGRSLAGVVVADGKPVPGATVYAGRMIFGNGTSNNAQMGPMGRGTKQDTTDARGAFAIAGFNDGDLTLVAEHPSIGRSRALRLPTVMPGQTELTLTLEKFGALTGVLRQGGKPAEGVFVSCQSTSTPGAIYSVASGPDGSYRFDRLAPDAYKVSATLGMPMTGMKFYSKQVEVPPGAEVTVDLAVEPGAVTLDVTAVPSNGALGVANVWLATGSISATTANELGVILAAAGPGASQWVIVRRGEPARFGEVAPGRYSVCVVPYPAEIQGMAAMGYAERHGDALPAFCKAVTVGTASPQAVSVPVELPPYVPDDPPPGGSGSGSAQ